jgi:hypothetical protein
MLSRFSRAVMWALCVILTLGSFEMCAQDKLQARPLVTKVIDTSQQEELAGTVNALASPQVDRGAIDTAQPIGRVLLLLNRPAERTAALETFLTNVQTTGGTEFHHWLTPEEFGQRFGPSGTDVAAVTSWLQSEGLHVEAVSRSQQVIEFSGTAGQFNSAFSTRLDRFEINGAIHALNATALHVPAALHDSIASVSPPDSLARSTSITQSGRANFHADVAHPHWTQAGGATPMYALAPADLATQYDLGPLYAAGVNGSGEIIGVIGVSNINAAEVDTFRSTFGIAKGPVQVIVDGADPGLFNDPTLGYGDVNDDPTVSYLGVETAGGLAPGAQIRLYVSGGSEYQDSLLLAAQRAVDDDQADVISLGFSECEPFLGMSNGNALYAALWQQAAAQGQTVVVAAGYWGSAGCESVDYGPAANGMGSSPWNLSVGGTDFFYSDYATGGASASGLWNSTNDPVTKASLKASLPEQVWNDGLGQNSVPSTPYSPIWAGGGAPSSCGTVSQTPENPTLQCVSGWPKPAWQSANGVPQDGVRDTPDVSLFAGDGQNFSAYAICEFAQDCVPDANGNFSADFVGGTSAAAPAMAAIMALVDQKYGRQGQAAPVFYALSKLAPSVFHDITLGGNNRSCTVMAGVPDCVAGPNGTGIGLGYQAGTGYDLASGLGTIDAAQLVNHWADVTAKSSTTTLQLSSQSFQHGQSVTTSVKVAGSDGGTPSGDVALITTSSLSAQQGQGIISLHGGVGSETLTTLPGGTYQLTGRYGGDGIYGPSSSAPVSVTVTPEASEINFQTVLTGHYIGFAPFTPGEIAAYGQPIQFTVHPTGASGDGVATGSATFTLNTTTFSAALNAGGYASWTPQALPVGQYTASATYAGDLSFAASTSTKLPFSIVPGIPDIGADSNATSSVVHQGDVVTVGVTVGTQQLQAPGTLAPTGQVEAALGSCNLYGNLVYQQVGTLSVPAGTSSTVSSVLLTIPNVAAGYYCVRVLYSGDANWNSETTLEVPGFNVLPSPGVPTTTALQITPTTIVAGLTTTMIATVSAPAGYSTAPTGSVTFYDNGSDGNGTYDLYGELTPGPNGTSTAELVRVPASHFFNSGVNHMTAGYSGDSIYSPSTSPTVDITATQPGGDFKLEASQTQITLAGGKSGTVSLNLTALLGFSGTVSLTCTPSTTAATCNVSPGSIALTNSGTATLSFNAYTAQLEHRPMDRTVLAALGVCVLLVWPRRRRWHRLMLCVFGLVVAAGVSGCGSSSTPVSGGGGSSNQPTTAGSYTVGVTATSGTITHQLTVLVTVQ